MLGILLFITLVIADIVRIFKNNDEFDGIMLFARPIVAFVGALLCGGTFWTSLLWAVGWGVVGFIVSELLSEHFGSSSDNYETLSAPAETISGPIDNEIVELTNIIVNKIASHYPGGIHLFVSDCYTKIEFYDFEDSYSQEFRTVVHQGTCTFGYDWVLKYYYGNLTETEALLLRNSGKTNHLGNWEIELRSRNTGPSTISKVKDILRNHPDTVEVEISTGAYDTTKCSAHIEPSKEGLKRDTSQSIGAGSNNPTDNRVVSKPHSRTQQPQHNSTPAPTTVNPPVHSKAAQDKGYTSIQLKETDDGLQICETHYVETEGIFNFYIDYEDGRIFIDWKNGSPQETIGYYEQKADPIYGAKVFDRSKKRVIGRVGNELIYFRSREADPISGRYSPDEECLAYYTKNGNITALGALPYMGFFQGSELGGAAAFVAIFYAYKFKGVYRDYFEMNPDSFKEKHRNYLHPMGW